MTGSWTGGVADLGAVPLTRPNLLNVAGLRRFVAERGRVDKPPLLPREQYRALPPRERRRYDRAREAANANIDIIETPMGNQVGAAIEDGVWMNAQSRSSGAKPGFMVNGGGAQGKTSIVLEVIANFMEEWLEDHRLPVEPGGPRDAHEPVVYVRTPDLPTGRGICKAILKAVGEPFRERDDFNTLQLQVHDVLVDLGVRVLILDDITRIKLHRQDDQTVLDLIRSLMDSGATVILIGVGIPASGLLREGGSTDELDRGSVTLSGEKRLRKLASEDDAERTQTERRFTLLHVRNFGYGTPEQVQEWTTFLAGVADQLRLYGVDHTTLLHDGLPEYIYRRTGGVVGSVVQLVWKASRIAMRERDPETGDELITREVLDQVDIDFGAEDGRIAEAGETPLVPQHKPAGTRRTGRSTVLDDKHGQAR